MGQILARAAASSSPVHRTQGLSCPPVEDAPHFTMLDARVEEDLPSRLLIPLGGVETLRLDLRVEGDDRLSAARGAAGDLVVDGGDQGSPQAATPRFALDGESSEVEMVVAVGDDAHGAQCAPVLVEGGKVKDV